MTGIVAVDAGAAVSETAMKDGVVAEEGQQRKIELVAEAGSKAVGKGCKESKIGSDDSWQQQ